MNARKFVLIASNERKIGLHEIKLAGSVSDEYRHPAVRERGIVGERLVSVKATVGGNYSVRLGSDAVSLPPNVHAKCAMRQQGHDRRNPVGCGPNHGLERVRRFRGHLCREADRKEVGKVGSIDNTEIDPLPIPECDRVGGRFERIDPEAQRKTISGTGGHDAQRIPAVCEKGHDGGLRAVPATNDD